MASVTDEQLEELRVATEKKRQKIEDAKGTLASREADATREVEYLQLQAENVRLDAELAAVTAASKVGSVKAGSEGLVNQAKEQLAQAEAVAAQPVGPVDTNVENKDDDKKDGGNS